MDVLYLLIPLSVLLVLGIIGVFAWALFQGQFDDLEGEGVRILQQEERGIDVHQVRKDDLGQESRQ